MLSKNGTRMNAAKLLGRDRYSSYWSCSDEWGNVYVWDADQNAENSAWDNRLDGYMMPGFVAEGLNYKASLELSTEDEPLTPYIDLQESEIVRDDLT